MAVHDAFYTDRFRAVSGFYREGDAGQQVDFFGKAVPLRPGGRILDLGCGFGRHTVALARKGYAVTGYDASEDYLAAARKAAAEAAVPVAFIRKDMRQLDEREAFDAVLSLSTSLAFYDDTTTEDILRRICAALVPRGFFVFDQGNIFQLIEDFVRHRGPVTTTLPDGRVHHCTFRFDAATLVLSRRSVLESGGGREEAGWDIRYFVLPELRRLLAEAGFTVCRVFGDYDGSDYSLDSKRLIAISQKV